MKKDKAKGVDCSEKTTSMPLKSQIQSPKTKERKKSARILPLDCWEKRETKVFFYVFGRELREEKRENLPRKML